MQVPTAILEKMLSKILKFMSGVFLKNNEKHLQIP
jgi:hypothetical protein